jgi:hypothetical protein
MKKGVISTLSDALMSKVAEAAQASHDVELNSRFELLAPGFREAGVLGFSVEFSGSGDSGNGCDITITTLDGTALGYQETQEFLKDKLMPGSEALLVDVIELLVDQAIDANDMDGYENDSGGRGTLNYSIEGTASFEGFYNEEEQSPSDYSWDSPDEIPVAKSILEPFLAKLKELGVGLVTAEYTGGGDSGDIDNVAFILAGETEDVGPDSEETQGSEVNPVTDVSVAFPSRSYDIVNHTYVYDPVTEESYKDLPLRDVAERLLFILIENTGHSGWENNEGGGGNLTLNVDGEVTLEHYDYVDKEVQVANTKYEFTGAPAPEMMALPGPDVGP